MKLEMSWEIWTSAECVAHTGTYESALSACGNDYGRTLTVYSPEGRIATIWHDDQQQS